jgi:hypothetical protein
LGVCFPTKAERIGSIIRYCGASAVFCAGVGVSDENFCGAGITETSYYLWSQNTVGGLIGVAYTDNGEFAHVYGTNHMVTTHYTAPIMTPNNVGGSPQQCFMTIDYDTLALCVTVFQGSVTMFAYDDEQCVITDDEGTTLTCVFEPTLRGGSNRALEEKYLWGVHDNNMRGKLQNHTNRGTVTFNRKVLLDRLRDAVKRTGGKPSSYRLDVRVRIEQGQDVCCFTVENRGNSASSVVAPIKSADGVGWEPTTKYHTNPKNLGDLGAGSVPRVVSCPVLLVGYRRGEASM